MKNLYYKILTIFITALLYGGCYTVIWTPEEEFPVENNYSEFYSETYYGDYYSFYDYPWWLRISPPNTKVGTGFVRDENSSTSAVRNDGQGRSNNDRRQILQTNPPSREVSTTSSGSSTSKSSSTSSNTSSVNSSSNNSRNSDNNSVRNSSSGGRNSNSGRR